MDQFIVKKSLLNGEMTAPASKSHTLRAILFASLASGKSRIYKYLPSPDTESMIKACRLLGATIEVAPNYLDIQGMKGRLDHIDDVIQAGNSGIVLRFCTAIGALAKQPVVVTGDDSIRHQRPMKPLLEGLSQLGVSVNSMRGDGFAPVIVQGPMKPGKVTIDGRDSQHVSALLIASACAVGPIEVNVKNPGEKPWVALTLDWFDRLGIRYINQNYTYYRMEGNSLYAGFEYTAPGDFSSIAFPMAAALLTQSEITIKNINMKDSQGDKKLIDVLQKMGARIEVDEANNSLHVRKTMVLKGITIDINDFVDAITILAVVACFAEGETHIYNASVAKQKECNRIHCIAKELQKMGADITETDDGLCVRKSVLKPAQVQSYNDHRMAMSLTVAALTMEEESSISSVACVSKTFPDFVKDFNALGACIKI